MKLQRKRLSIAIAFALMFVIAASVITALPIAFGQRLIPMTAIRWVGPETVGVNQQVLLQGGVYPAPEYSVNLSFYIEGPGGFNQTIVKTGSKHAHAYFYYTVNKTGSWRFRISYAGDATHTAVTSSFASWVVQEAPVAPLRKQVTYSYVGTVPKKVGVGDYIYIVGWITPPTEISGQIYDPGYEYIITKPNGATVTVKKDPDSTAATSIAYPCDQAGTWSVKMSWAGDKLHEGAISTSVTWEVEEGFVQPTIPVVPIPDYPWTYPITGEYREWFAISGPWTHERSDASGSYFNPYTDGPETPHVLWKKLAQAGGGILGGEPGHLSVAKGDAPIFVSEQGRLYTARAEPYITNASSLTTHPVLYCYDQYTGELIYRSEMPGTGTGTSLFIEVTPYGKIDPKVGVRDEAYVIWMSGDGLWEVDPLSGVCSYYLPGRAGTYHDGAIYIANYNGTTGATQSGTMTKFDTRLRNAAWTARIPSFNFLWEDIIFRGAQNTGGYFFGQQMWTWNATTGAPIVDGAIIDLYSTESVGRTLIGYGKWFFHCSTTRSVHAVDLYTGKLAWSSEPRESPWGTFAAYTESWGYGNVYFRSWDGHMYCYDAASGELKWKFYAGDTAETAMGTFAWWGDAIIADGKVYAATGEHTVPNPPPRGNTLFCLDAYTGELIWKLEGILGRQAHGGIASGILWYFNDYDSSVWAFGKGETATTVSLQQDVVANGASVLIKGSVTDQTAAVKGTAAVSDASMAAWMQYLFNNAPEPADAVGVSVALAAIGSDGSVVDIGHAVSTSSGQFSIEWAPPGEGVYRIVVSFDGSGSYYGSWGETSLAVTAAADSSTEAPVAADNSALFTGLIVAVVVAIVIGLVNLAIVLKKQQK